MPRSKLIRAALLVAGACALFYFFPLFHIRRLNSEAVANASQVSTHAVAKSADPTSYVEAFWNGPLPKGEDTIDIVELWQAFDADSAKAKQEFGRQGGLGGASYFCVRASGTVESVEKNRCVIAVPSESRRACIELGVIVDNTIREAIGVDVNEFANSQDFNAVSSALNLRVESEVIKPNKDQLQPGVTVKFVGCAKIGRQSDLDPLCLVPIRIELVQGENTK